MYSVAANIRVHVCLRVTFLYNEVMRADNNEYSFTSIIYTFRGPSVVINLLYFYLIAGLRKSALLDLTEITRHV